MAAVIALSIRAATPPAVAGQNRNTPAPRAAAPAPHLGGGAPHMPGGMGGGMPGSMGGGMPGGMRGPGGFGAAGGGAHLPSGMAAGGAHVPGGMAVGGTHVPGGMGAGAHVPGSFGSAAHVPGGVAGHAPEAHFSPARPGGAPFGGASHEAGLRPGEHGVTGGREFGGREPGGHQAGPRFGGEGRGGEAHGFGTETGRHDPRLGGPGAGHTHGLEAGAAHHEARPYLHAEEHRDIARDRAFAERHAGDFHSRNVHDFSARELATWRGGAWRREWHYGREGWWWEVDGVWYPYPEPIWPYPLEVAELTVYETAFIDGPEPNTIVAEGRPITIPPLPAAPAGRYRCDEPRGFYPTVASCSVPWELVADPSPSGLQSQD